MQLSSNFLDTPNLLDDSPTLFLSELAKTSKWQTLDLAQYPIGPLPDQSELNRLSGMLDPVDPREVISVYGPWVEHIYQTKIETQLQDCPVMVGITGSVCSGKTTAARVLHHLFAQRFGEDKTTLLTLDNFLKPNAEIERCPGGMTCKGFPQTFNFEILLKALREIHKGQSVKIPCYDHAHYDIFENRFKTIAPNQKVVIVEGIIAAQDTPTEQGMVEHIRDFCQTMVFVQTEHDQRVLPEWFEERLLLFAKSARQTRTGHLVIRYAQQLKKFDAAITAGCPLEEAEASFEQAIRLDAQRIWSQTNGPNYQTYIEPSRAFCDTVLLKKANHKILGVFTRQPKKSSHNVLL